MKRISLLLLWGFFIQVTFAQFPLGKSAGQEITEKALKGSIFIVKQAYQLKDKKSGDLFGKNGKEEFGAAYSYAVLTVLGGYAPTNIFTPWENDKAFDEYKEKYEPVNANTWLRSLEHKAVYNKISISEPDSNEGFSLFNISDTLQNQRLGIDGQTGEKDGWMVWLTSSESLQESESTAVTVLPINKIITINEKDKFYDIDPPTKTGHILGGLYVCPTYKGGGHVEYLLVGFAVQKDNKWQMYVPFIGMKAESVKYAPATTESLEENNGLTPINKNKSESKKKREKKTKKQ